MEANPVDPDCEGEPTTIALVQEELDTFCRRVALPPGWRIVGSAKAGDGLIGSPAFTCTLTMTAPFRGRFCHEATWPRPTDPKHLERCMFSAFCRLVAKRIEMGFKGLIAFDGRNVLAMADALDAPETDAADAV